MSRLAVLKKALESVIVPPDSTVEEPSESIVLPESQLEEDLQSMISEQALVNQEGREIDQVGSQISDLGMKVEEILTEGAEPTQHQADLVKLSVENLLLQFNIRQVHQGLESLTTPRRQLEHSLEGIREIGKRIAQGVVVGHKKGHDAFLDQFKTIEGQISKYQQRTNSGKAEFDKKSKHWKNSEHKGSLVEVNGFFRKNEVQVSDVIAATQEDVSMISYVLVEFAKQNHDMIKKYCATFDGVTPSDKDVFLSNIRKLESFSKCEDLFKKDILGKFIFLSDWGYTMGGGNEVDVVKVDGKSYDKIADLGEWNEIDIIRPQEKVTKKENAIDLSMSTEDIGTLFELSDKYLSTIKEFLQIQKSTEEIIKKFEETNDQTVWSPNRSIFDEATRDKYQALSEMAQNYESNLFESLKLSVFTQAVKHALQGARYTNYLGLRMIANAK